MKNKKFKIIFSIFCFAFLLFFSSIVPVFAEEYVMQLKTKYEFNAIALYARAGSGGKPIGKALTSEKVKSGLSILSANKTSHNKLSSFNADFSMTAAFVFNKNCNDSVNGCWALNTNWTPEKDAVWFGSDIIASMKSDDNTKDFIQIYKNNGSTALQDAVQTIWDSRSPVKGENAIWIGNVYYGSPVKYEDLKKLESIDKFYACFLGTFNGGTMFTYGDGTSLADAKKLCESDYNIQEDNGVQYSIVYEVTRKKETKKTISDDKNIGITCKWISAVSDGEINGEASIDTMSREASFILNTSTGKGFVAGINISKITASFATSGVTIANWASLSEGTAVDNFGVKEHRPADIVKIVGYVIDAIVVVVGVAAIVATAGTATPGVVGALVAAKSITGIVFKTAMTTIATTVVTQVGAYVLNYANGPEVEMCSGNFDGFGNECSVDSNIKCQIGEFKKDPGKNEKEEVTCDILDTDFGKILKFVMNIIRGVGCAILVLFSIIDFVKPIISSDADSLKKNGTIFIKRLIIFVLLLFVPALVKLALSLIDQDSCSNI